MSAANTITLDQVQPELVSWLWQGRIPFGKLTVLDGDPGLGKSLVTLDIAARLTTGRAMPDGSYPDISGPVSVVIVTVEDGLADTIRPRLELAGANLALVTAITGVPTSDGYERGIVLPDDWQLVFEVVEATGARLLILDPLMALLGGDVNSYRDQDIRRALTPGVRFSEETGAALGVVRHLNKSGGSNAVYRGGGSIGITGAARSVLLFGKDPDEPETRRVMAVAKSNLSAPVPALAYRVEDAGGHPRLAWDGPTSHSASDLLVADDDERRDAREEAVEFLRDALSSGSRETKQVLLDARKQGISEATLRRARRELGVKAEKVGFGDSGQWCLILPDEAKALTESLRCSPNSVSALAECERLSTLDQVLCHVCGSPLPTQIDRERGVHRHCEADALTAFSANGRYDECKS